MKTAWATINKILPFSCVDGPGNRLVIFFQGCNYRCWNCHNPYTISLCDHCGDCVSTCPDNALSLKDDKVIWLSDNCSNCDTCIDTCNNYATPKATQHSVDDILQLVHRYLPFINGLTFSGGESTMQLPFILQLCKAIKTDEKLNHLTCLIDSNGSLSETGWHRVMPYFDGAMIDLKSWDDQVHYKLTGGHVQRVLQSIRLLSEQNKLQEVRLLLIDNAFCDLFEKADEICAFLTSLHHVPTVRLNAFHSHGVFGEAQHWPSTTKEKVEAFADILRSKGIPNVITPELYL